MMFLGALLLSVGIAAAATGQKNPCGEIGSVKVSCVRKYLAAHSSGKAIENGPHLDPYTIYPTYAFLPTFNMSLLKFDDQMVGLSNSIVRQFTVDYDNDVTILGLKHPQVWIPTGPIILYFHRDGNTSIAVQTVYEDYYYDLLTTTFFPGTHRLDLANRQTRYVVPVTPSISFGNANLTAATEEHEFINNTVTALNNGFYTLLSETMITLCKEMVTGYVGQNLVTLEGPEALATVTPRYY